MIDQGLFNVLSTTCVAVIGWVLKTFWENLKSLERMDLEINRRIDNDVIKEMNQFRVHVAQSYTPKDQFELRMDRIFEKLDRIEEKIDRKADKKRVDEPL